MLFLFVSVNSYAQKDSAKFQQMQELESVLKDKFKSNLGIDDEKTNKLIELQKENKKQLREYRKEEKEIYDQHLPKHSSLQGMAFFENFCIGCLG